MPDDLHDRMTDLTHRLFVLTYKLGCWYALAKKDIRSDSCLEAGNQCQNEVSGLTQAVLRTVHYLP